LSSRLVILVNEGDAEQRKYALGRGRLRSLLTIGVFVFTLAAGGAGAGAWLLRGHVENTPSAQAENVLLKARLQALEGRLSRVDLTLDRVMGYDAKIRQLTRDDHGAKAFGIGPLSELEIAAAEREGRGVNLPGEELELGVTRSNTLEEQLDDLDLRARSLQERLEREEESLQEVRGYLDDRTSLLDAHPRMWPARGWVTSGYGWRNSPHGGGRRLHAGLDVAAPRGTPVVAPADGHVVFAGYHSAYGNLVVIDHGYGITTKYAHLSRMLVQVGDRVQRGELMAKVGNTGRSTGPHLHFEVLKDGVPTNPRRFLDAR
jgi:murein DD-endopeptidase MepM/ murein hydrolase activator NlpD